MRISAFSVALSAVFLALSQPRAQASCGAASCPLDTASHDAPKAGSLRLDFSFQYIDQDQPRVGRRKAAVGAVPNADHDEIATINRSYNFRADYDLDSRWGFGLMLPFIARTHDHFDVVAADDAHWGFTGVGDLSAQVRYALIPREDAEAPSLTATAAGKFPTGRTGAHNDDDLAEVAIQPGSGSYDFTGGFVYAQSLAEVVTFAGDHATLPFFAGVSYRKNFPGTDNYRLGDEFAVNLGSEYPLLARLHLLAQANLRVKSKDDRGDTAEDTSFTGGEYLYLSPGLRWPLAESLSGYLYVQLPVYQRVNKEQLTSDRNWVFGLTYSFSGLGL